ncbi:2-dehydropantoate 2-reductase [Allostella vacuolata]|nr:2-dehydropantoate 2-reductase [Stella vacuolata]
MDSRIVIWGSGAIGGTIGAHLARAGHPVLFVDQMEAHVDAIARDGLTLTGPISAFTVQAPAATPAAVVGRYDLVLLAVKAQDTAEAVEAIRPHLADDGAIVSIQNGLNEPVIAGIVGRERTIGAFVNFGADWIKPGEIMYGGRGPVVVGEIDGAFTPRITAIHQLLQDFEPEAVLTDNIFGYLWGKLAFSGILISSALTNETLGDFFGSQPMRPLVIAVVREILAVARAEGIWPMGFQGFEPDAFAEYDMAAIGRSMDALVESRRHSAKLHTGFWRDLAVRKRKSEVENQLAPIQAAARRHGLATPIVDRLRSLIEDIESGRRPLGMALAEELRAVALASPSIAA